jgi:DNA-binding LytR/AlgR family response regulator
MKIQFVRVHEQEDENIIISYSIENEIVTRLKEYVEQLNKEHSQMEVYKGEKSYYVDVESILFFETDDGKIIAHTKDDAYESKFKLYELEEKLPNCFLRVSKSTILNVKHVYSIEKNLTSSSCVEFKNTYKTIYVSRRYYKELKNTLKEMRIKI